MINKVKINQQKGRTSFCTTEQRGDSCPGFTKCFRHSVTAKQPVKQWAKGINIHVSKGQIQMANRHLKKCPGPLTIREIQVKTTLRFHPSHIWPAV